MHSSRSAFLGGLLLFGQAALAQSAPAVFPPVTAHSWTLTTDPGVQRVRDVDFFGATLFPDPNVVRTLEAGIKDKKVTAGIADSAQRVRILGRIFVAMAFGGLRYCTAENDVSRLMDWKWELATALSHGQRVIFEVKGVDGADVYNLFVNGFIKPDFKDPYGRTAASHGFKWKDGQLTELKYKGFSLVYAVTDGLRGVHHGINIPYGGLGNPRLDGNLVGPEGMALDPATGTLVKKLQHGHLFLHEATHSENGQVVESGLMVGLEGSASGYTNMYGSTHTAASATKDATKEACVNGGQKMQVLLGKAGPAQVGGMWVRLSRDDFRALQEVIRAVDNTPTTPAKQNFFRNLLSAESPGAARQVLAEAYPRAMPSR